MSSLEELKFTATIGHRLVCPDPDDLTRETPYSIQLKLIAALEAVMGLESYSTYEYHSTGTAQFFGEGYDHALEVAREVIEEKLK